VTKQVNVRKFSRSKVSIAAILVPKGGTPIDVEVVDISMSGIFVHADKKLAVGTRCQVKILLGHFRHEMPIGAAGSVVRCHDGGIAIKFDEVKIDTAQELQNLIAFNSEDPERTIVEFSQHGGWIFNPTNSRH